MSLTPLNAVTGEGIETKAVEPSASRDRPENEPHAHTVASARNATENPNPAASLVTPLMSVRCTGGCPMPSVHSNTTPSERSPLAPTADENTPETTCGRAVKPGA